MRKFFLKSKVVLLGLFGVAAGLSAEFQAINWHDLLVTFGIPDVSAGKIVTVGSFAFLMLRILGGGLAFKAAPPAEPDYSGGH